MIPNPNPNPKAKTLRLVSALTAITVVGFSASPVHALPIPLDPSDPAVSELWVNPNARADDELSGVDVEISDFVMPDSNLTVQVGESFKAQVRVTNRSSETLSNITLQARRAEASFDMASARVAATDNNYGYFGAMVTLDDELEPGESVETEVEISTDSLSISQPGSYPTMLALSGQLDGVAQHLDSQRFLLPVLSDTTDTEDTATPTTMIYPISAQTNVLGGETGEAPEEPPLLVSSDALAGEDWR